MLISRTGLKKQCLKKGTFFRCNFPEKQQRCFSFRFMWSGELTCRENGRLSHGVRGRCVQEEAGINCRKHVETHWILVFFFLNFLVQHSNKDLNLLSVGVSGRESIAPVKGIREKF